MARVHCGEVTAALPLLMSEAYDGVLLDPPWTDAALPGALAGAATVVRVGGWALAVHAASDVPSAQGWTLDRTRRHGDAAISLFFREDGEE